VPVLVLSCLSAGVAAGTVVRQRLRPPPAPPAEPAARRSIPVEEPVALTPQAALARIDTLVRAGSFEKALDACKSAAALVDGRALAYREAVCLEATGRLKEAGEKYHKAELAERDQAAWARAVLGQSRCAVASGDLGEARRLLDRVALRSGHPDCAGTHVYDECLFLRARIDSLSLGPVRAVDPFEPQAVAWPSLGASLDRYFEWLPPETVPTGSVGPARPNAVEVRRSPSGAGLDVTAHLPGRPLPDVLRAVAAAAGMRLEVNEAASAALAKEVAAVDVESMPLPELLAALTGRCGVRWRPAGESLIASLAPAPSPQREAVAASFRRAISAAPEHPLAHAARVYVGNFEFLAGRAREAEREYEAVLAAAPEAPEARHAAYNVGLAELKLGEPRSARSRFVGLVDRAPRSRWADYGWWWAGRIDLDGGDTAGAKRAFRSALGGRTREVTSASAAGACVCELLDGHEAAAREVLRGSRIDTRDAHAALGHFLESLLRYRAAPTDGRRERLLKALHAAGDARKIGPGGALLAGRVYRELDLGGRMAALYDEVSESTRGPVAARMTYDAATWYDLTERPELARQRYLAVAATDARELGAQAELRLAAMALRQRKAEECVRRCRAVLDRPGVDRPEVLALMGRAYESQRQYRLAADCFAGRVPGE
jgi:tetratricopeptide (TPR) repeat protein